MDEKKIILYGKPDLEQLDIEEFRLLIDALAFSVLEIHREKEEENGESGQQ